MLFLAACALAQRGDVKGEPQPDPPPEWNIPAAPVLAPTDALGAFRVAEGFRIELVASEPLVEDPVAIAFDGQGRLWVVEMRTYMPDVDGEGDTVLGERSPESCVAVLTDTDGDGRMDHRTVFAEDLVLPRSVLPLEHGALILEPPYLRYYRDTQGDLVWDEEDIVSYGFGGLHNVEHAPNSLLWTIDNGIHLAGHPGRFVGRVGTWTQEATAGGGQWGLTQDDWGRLRYNNNSDQLRGDALPPTAAVRNPNLGVAAGVDYRLAASQKVWPARLNPGVNRGYRPETLRPDGTLASFTAACGPTIYRGDAFPAAFHGNAFVAEPAGNLVKRNLLVEDPETGVVRATDAYQEAEFLTSTDERFRPVNLTTGPDGALYIVDMYRGIIQHRVFVTSYLRRQILSRSLDRPLGLGRIWRVVPEGFRQPAPPRLHEKTATELVSILGHPNGWWRDTAQRLLVERQDLSAEGALRERVRTGKGTPVIVHALWALHGLGCLTDGDVLRALDDPEPRVRCHGLRLAGPRLAGSAILASKVLQLPVDGRDIERAHRVLALSELKTPDALSRLADYLAHSARDARVRQGVLTGLQGRELDFLRLLAADVRFQDNREGRPALWREIARCIIREDIPDRMRGLLTIAISQGTPWQLQAVLDGIRDVRGGAGNQKPVRLDREPEGIASRVLPESLRQKLDEVFAFVTWPTKPDWADLRLRPLTAEERVRFDRGAQVYAQVCRGCHQPNGGGLDGLAPPVSNSEWVAGPPDRLVRILEHGLSGPIEVSGRTWDLAMPGLPSFTDSDMAAVITFLRRAFGNEADPVSPEFVQRERARHQKRKGAWTASELQR